jgi:hypothetical protein
MSDRVRYFYRTEVEEGVERVFTVAYTHDIDSGATQYGGTVFRHPEGDTKESFLKAPHRQTAARRLAVRPVRLTVQADSYSEVENQIREAIREQGVRGPRNTA